MFKRIYRAVTPVLRNHSTNAVVDAVVLELLSSWDLVRVDPYRAHFAKEGKTASVWISNRMYAIASEGEVNGVGWNCGMPSRSTCHLLCDRIDAALLRTTK